MFTLCNTFVQFEFDLVHLYIYSNMYIHYDKTCLRHKKLGEPYQSLGCFVAFFVLLASFDCFVLLVCWSAFLIFYLFMVFCILVNFLKVGWCSIFKS